MGDIEYKNVNYFCALIIYLGTLLDFLGSFNSDLLDWLQGGVFVYM
jgi:hypothetical protein